MQIQSNVKTHFEQKNLTAADFARWCSRRMVKEDDTTYFTARRVVNAGETNIRLHTAMLLSEFLGVPVNDLFVINGHPNL